jgi:hypothetical protein
MVSVKDVQDRVRKIEICDSDASEKLTKASISDALNIDIAFYLNIILVKSHFRQNESAFDFISFTTSFYRTNTKLNTHLLSEKEANNLTYINVTLVMKC